MQLFMKMVEKKTKKSPIQSKSMAIFKQYFEDKKCTKLSPDKPDHRNCRESIAANYIFDTAKRTSQKQRYGGFGEARSEMH